MGADRPVEEEIRDVNPSIRPHVVILGAGASRAALPNGDKNGRRLPVLNDMIETVGLGPILMEAGVEHEGRNFEAVYSELAERNETPGLLRRIERTVFDYFAALELPDEPTLYDHLVLSLREHDRIATFNWDPFLVQACARNGRVGTTPRFVFLHGNVAIGYCDRHTPMSMGNRGNACRHCGEPLRESPLLYPVTRKDYKSDPAIAAFWEDIQKALKRAFMFTIFGYSAPSTDVEAMTLLQEAWGPNVGREYEEIEIIDIRDEEELGESWDAFIFSHHYRVHGAFYDCFLARHPRRSVESMWAQVMDARFIDEHPAPRGVGFGSLHEWFGPLIDAERAVATESQG